MKRNLILILSLLISGAGFGLDLGLAVQPDSIKQNSRLIGKVVDIKQSTVYSLLDGDPRTESIILLNKTDLFPGSFFIEFDKAYPVDKISLFNGGNAGNDFSPAKFVRITAYLKTLSKNGKALETQVYQFTTPLLNIKDRYSLYLNETIIASRWQIAIEEIFNSNDGPYSFAALGEVEFWLNDEMYRVKNLPELKESIEKEWRDSCQKELLTAHSMVKHIVFQENKSLILSTWKDAGIAINSLNIYPDEPLTLDIEFTKTSDYEGEIKAGKKNGAISMMPEGGTLLPRYYFTDALALGKWKIDPDGKLWIKIGQSDWKKSRSLLDFTDTGLTPYLESQDYRPNSEKSSRKKNR